MNKFFSRTKKGIAKATISPLPTLATPRMGGAGGANPIVNEQPLDIKDPPINDGTFYTDKKIFQQMPFGLNDASFMNSSIIFEGEMENNRFTPNIFGTWSDIYNAFCGTFKLETAPDGLIRLEDSIYHLLFLLGRVAILKIDDNDFMVGNYSIVKSDHYGRIKEGSFIPWNYAKGQPDEDRIIPITETNNTNIVNTTWGQFGIPIFIVAGYYVKMRNILYAYKHINLNMSVLSKIIGVDSQGKQILEPFLKSLFNLDPANFPNPIQIVDFSQDENTKEIKLNFKDMKDQVDIGTEYKGTEINLDIEGLTKELFRVVGLRTDTITKTGTYQERSNEAQVSQATSYFDATENKFLRTFRNLEMDFKDKFGIDIKFSTIYQLQKQEQEKEQDEIMEDVGENDESKKI